MLQGTNNAGTDHDYNTSLGSTQCPGARWNTEVGRIRSVDAGQCVC